MNLGPPKNAECSQKRKSKVKNLKEHIKSGRYQIDVFKVAQAMLNHVDAGVDKGIEVALAFHMRPNEDEDDLAASLT